MLNITKIDDGLLFSKDGVNEQIFPLNELVLLVEDISDIVVFKTDDYYETVFQARWQDITIEGERVTKENIVEKFNAIANTPQGGGTKINAGTNITLQPEADGSITISATGELGGTVSWNDVTDKPSTFTPSAHNHVVADITDLQGKLDAKQDTLVSGTNIKTINGQDILGSGNIEIQGGSGDVTKQYVDEQLALKVDKSVYEADKATFALKTEIPSIDGLATSEELQNGLEGKQDKGDYALKSELPDISGLATKEELASKADTSALATKQDTLVSGTNIKTINGQTVLGEGNIEIQGGGSGISDAPSDGKKYVRQNANWVQETTVDTSNFATKAELEGKVDDAEIADMLTKTEAASTYQPKGDYLTAIPSEYVTETELSEKGYATTVQLDAKLDTETYNSDKATFATKEELSGKANTSDLSNYLQTSVAESTYAKESSLEELKTSKLDVSTYNQDKETFALKTEIPNDYLTDADLTDYLTKDEASDTYRQKKIINFNRTNRSTEITNAWANSLNNIGATFQYVSFDEGATYNNVLYCGYRSYDGAGNRKGVGITEIDGKMRSVIFEFSGIDCVATLEDEIDLNDYATKSELANKVDTSTYNSDKATFATKEELADKADASALATKQDTLVSGTNIKTVNGNSLLGSGDIIIEGGTGDVTRQYVDEQLALKADKTSVPTVQSSTLGNENNYVYSVGAINDKKNVLSLISSDENETNLNITYQTWNNDTKVMMKLRNASQTLDGAMSSEDKIKLDSINVEEMLTKTEASTTYALQSALQAALDRISALESQVGNISTQLDNINGETIN